MGEGYGDISDPWQHLVQRAHKRPCLLSFTRSAHEAGGKAVHNSLGGNKCLHFGVTLPSLSTVAKHELGMLRLEL